MYMYGKRNQLICTWKPLHSTKCAANHLQVVVDDLVPLLSLKKDMYPIHSLNGRQEERTEASIIEYEFNCS